MRRTYFITSTANGWIRLFDRPEFSQIILNSLAFMISEERIKLHGYVIMPNHLHLILTVSKSYDLSSFLRDFHKFTSQQIIKILRNESSSLLEKLEVDKNDRRYQVWMETHAPKAIEMFPFLRQKLEYIHNNPLSPRWSLCDKPEDYPFSSARDYILKEDGKLKIEIMTPWTEA